MSPLSLSSCIANTFKWHFKTKQGKASLVWDEALHAAGKNPDFHRADLWNAIESGNFPEWELNVQVVDEEEAAGFDFDVLDPTKIIPEELAPLQPLGVLKLNANPVNYFAEVEQAAFSPSRMVEGWGPSADPVLQARLFSYAGAYLDNLLCRSFLTALLRHASLSSRRELHGKPFCLHLTKNPFLIRYFPSSKSL